jgi:hypothetical protein
MQEAVGWSQRVVAGPTPESRNAAIAEAPAARIIAPVRGQG